MDYDTWKTTPPEPDVIGHCAYCRSELYPRCEYTHDRDNNEYYCDDNCFIEHVRENGEVVTEEVEVIP